MRQAYGGNGQYKARIIVEPQRGSAGLCGAVPGNIVLLRSSSTYKTLGLRGFSPEDGSNSDTGIATRHNLYLVTTGLERITLPSCYPGVSSRCHSATSCCCVHSKPFRGPGRNAFARECFLPCACMATFQAVMRDVCHDVPCFKEWSCLCHRGRRSHAACS